MGKSIFIAGPDPTLELAYSDVWLAALYSRRVLVFQVPSTAHGHALSTLERGLRSLLNNIPELGSESVIVQKNSNTPWRALKPYQGVELVTKDLTKSFPSFMELQNQGFPITAFKDHELMPIPLNIDAVPLPQAKFQISFINDGILLSVCILHHLTDGNGMNTIIHALSNECRRATKADSTQSIMLNTDRSLLETLYGSQDDLSYHPAYRNIVKASWPRTRERLAMASSKSTEQAPQPKIIPSYFKLSPNGAVRLKKDASTSTPVSTHDAISALLWRTLMLARLALGRVKSSDTAKYSFPVDARRYIGLSPDWVGNCVYFCLVQRPILRFQEEVGKDNTLPAIAAQIREAIQTVDYNRVAGLMTARRANPYDIWWPPRQTNEPTILVTTSFYHSGLLDHNWGEAFGPIKHFSSTDVGALAGNLRRTSFVGPRIGSGGCFVMVGADEDELNFFKKDKFWNQYFEPLGPSQTTDL